MPGHFLLTTFGSLGDLHPYIAVGIALRRRGHTVTLASSEAYRDKVEGEGLLFHTLRPDVAFLLGNPELMARIYHPRKGSEYIVRDVFLPPIEQSYEDTLAIAKTADVLVSHPIAFATPIVAAQLRKPWMSVALQPAVIFSAFDPPKMAQYAALHAIIDRFGPGAWKHVWRFARHITAKWGQPLNRIRTRVGLPPLDSPILDDMFSPYGTQGWFSRVLATPQPDGPAGFQITGFPIYDKLAAGDSTLDPALESFLASGPPPIVFTLGSSAVFNAGAFYEESLAAAKSLGRRAVLLIGPEIQNRPTQPIPDTIHIAEYAPFSQLLSRGIATVHQGGVGTTAQSLLAGKPMLFVPYSHDQPDNARRCERLGVARTIARHKYKAARVARELEALLTQPDYATRTRQVAAEMRTEHGIETICDGLEKLLQPNQNAK